MARMNWIPKLYVIADRGAFTSDHAWLSRLEGLATQLPPEHAALQLRIKDTAPDTRLRLVKAARAAVEKALSNGLRVILNGTETEARELGFSGVHWPEADVPTPDTTPNAAWLRGASTHSASALQAAAQAGAQFATFGPVFAPSTKPVAGVGTEALAQAVAQASIPVLAIGGMTPERVATCLGAGAAGVALVSSLMLAHRPEHVIASYLRALQWAQPSNPGPKTWAEGVPQHG